jgi:hypothetical protein
MSNLAQFFRDSPTSMGVFYPKDYAIITFRSYSVAQQATQTLLYAGLTPASVRFIPPNEFLAFLDEIESSLAGAVMTYLSRLTDTEAANALLDAERAKEGAAFVAVRCATPEEAQHVLGLIRQFQPMAMDHYERGGLQSLISSAEPAALTHAPASVPDPITRAVEQLLPDVGHR